MNRINFKSVIVSLAVLISGNVGYIYGQASASTFRPDPLVAKKASDSPKERADQKVVVITGARFTYPLVQQWIDAYNTLNPEAQIIIESRGTNDPSKYDLLVEVYEKDEATKKQRDFVYIGRYAVLPVANANSAFAKKYSDKGLSKALINQLFFHDLFADKENQEKIDHPFTIYTRLQKAGVPTVFSSHFGFEQKDIQGKAIAGSDEHLLKSILRDSSAVSYLPISLIYDPVSRRPISGLAVLPIDLNDNGRVNDEEKFYGDLDQVLTRIESTKDKELKNLPLGYVHLSIDKSSQNSEALAFLRWVIQNGQSDLQRFGYLKPEASKVAKAEDFARASE